MASLFSVARLVRPSSSVLSLSQAFGNLKLAGPSSSLFSASLLNSRNIHISASKKAAANLPVQPAFSPSSLFKEAESSIGEEAKFDKYGKPIEREYKVATKNFKISLQKISMLANQLGGLDINQAILQMEFSQKRAAEKLKHVLCGARSNAERQLNFDPKRMYIHQAWVGKGRYIKNLIDIKGRGRFGLKEHPFCHMKFIFRERAAVVPPTVPGMNERRKVRGFRIRRNVWVAHKDQRPIYTPKPFYNW